MKVRTLHENKWLTLKAVSNKELFGDGEYVFVHETRCGGQAVAVLPFRWESDDSLSFLLRSETVPCWGPDPCIVALTGGVDSDSPAETAMHELEEEAGLVVTPEELIPLGACRSAKNSDTVYYLFACDVTNKDRGEARGDGSYLEQIAHCFWSKNLHDAVDPLVFVMVYRLMYLLEPNLVGGGKQ